MHSTPSRHSSRGSALLSVVVFTTVALLLVASLLSWSSTERKLNYRNALRLEARNAAEALAEYGFSQIRQKMENRSTVSLNPSGADALVMPPASFWSGGNVDTASLELTGGSLVQIPVGSDYYYEPTDINNESDPLKGKYVFRRDIRVIAKATVNPSSAFGAPITAYVSQRISVRGAPLFAHAIFYNMDLEIFNGPNMTISGPVHTNGSLYLYPGNGATLAFTDQVTATGRVYHAAKPGDSSGDAGSAAGRTGEVKINSKTNGSLAMKVGNIWKDSSQGNGTSAADWSDFRDYSSQRWNGNLQTNAHGVENYTPVAVSKYTEDATPGNGVDNSVNSGRALIEPSDYPAASDPDYNQKLTIEQQKYANNAGLYLTVNPSTQAITLTSRNRNDPTKNKILTLPSSGKLVTYIPYKATSTYSTTSSSKTYTTTQTGSGTNAGKYKYTPTTTATTTPVTVTYTSAGTATTNGSSTTSSPVTGSTTGWRSSPPSDHNTTITSSTTPTTPTLNTGMYDRHRGKGTDIIEVDMDALRLAVAAMAGSGSAKLSDGSNTAVTAADAIGGIDDKDWTGIVYIEVQGGPTTDLITGATNAATDPASMQTSVRLVNGKGKVPSYVGDNSSEGLTIATNAPVYVKGDYNADGSATDGTGGTDNSATTPDAGELPAAIVGDAVTILSKNFNDTTSLSAANPIATTDDIEISAALLVGLSPSNKNGTGVSSGGAHNLPRFLENWDKKKTFIRGSLVALFENRVFTEPHGSGYYSPPTRNWGFNSMFREGRYPPGTPRVMSYRRVDFTDMTAAEYDTAMASFGW
jgi:hypothetical protein